MREVYANSISSIKYRIIVDGIPTAATGNVTVSATDSSGLSVFSAVVATPTGKTAEYKVIIPPGAVTQYGILTVTWSFVVSSYSVTQTETYKIVSPYARWSDFVDENVSYDDFVEREAVSRYVIQAYCGQDFFKETASYSVIGTGSGVLMLPRRLLSLTSVTSDSQNNFFTDDTQWQIYADGEILRPLTTGTDRIYTSSTPFVQHGTFKRRHSYVVSGVWGWDTVPEEVTEAANILVSDFLCDQHTYRDRYLKTVTFDKWDIDFMPEAYDSTGNVLANQLLQRYRLYPNVGMI